jgi:hypothetical protein
VEVIWDSSVYSPNREGQWQQTFLAGYAGFVQGDAYAGYDALFATGAVVEVACWAHARRKFFEAQKTDPEGAARRHSRASAFASSVFRLTPVRDVPIILRSYHLRLLVRRYRC